MVYDHGSDCYVPVFYVLCTSKTEDMYWNAIQFVDQTVDQNLDPAEVICAFEAGIINAVKVQCPQSHVVGCLFHFKHAVRRRMKELRIHEAEVNIAMIRGVLDMLTVIEPGTISTQGIRWVHHLIHRRCEAEGILHSNDKLRQFWRYFRRTWLTKTNNPLERFNLELNTEFGTPHPGIPRFVGTIERTSRKYVRASAPELEGFEVPRAVATRELEEAEASSSCDDINHDNDSDDEQEEG
ncbi:TPA: hypothetical protein N0F65_004588 [Lagenidium giganteum]|uniref:MULE transposase domain-containing protein n=1 Tax=Lagenidium giganteum TaxID=4803 RepID=A0AAV2Z8Y9_9STRA|nr:TPA: hypothetical protein N0F65_004588 [Lagenidium giganteum]